ncbi:MAG TPA: ankyrin repeat domain-containing protein [Thermoanaerobaculia bacterium]|nr:ankyrin repeat domain-containing protein [Thermoanaerobaculia bacterium]
MRSLLLTLALCPLVAGPVFAGDPGFDLRMAASKGETAQVRALLDQGVPVDAADEYGATALSRAADKGHAEIVKLLLERGAKPDVADTFYESTPITWAAYNGHAEVVKLLIAAGADPSGAIGMAVSRGKTEVLKAVLESGKVPLDSLSGTLAMAKQGGQAEVVKILEEAGVKPPPPATAQVAPEILARYAGKYTSTAGFDCEMVFDPAAKNLTAKFSGGQPPLVLGAVNDTTFRPLMFDALTLVFKSEGEKVVGISLDQAGNKIEMTRVEAPAEEKP